MNAPPKAPCHSCNGTGIDPTVGFLDCEFCTPAAAGVSLSAPEQPEPKCATCNDHGEIGCLRPDGYDGERCPDCNPATTKRYHVTEAGLVEGEALGRLAVVLVADYDAAVRRIGNMICAKRQMDEELEIARDDLVIFKSALSALGEASKKLVVCARTSGGTAGSDQGLMDACTGVEDVITLAGIARAINEFDRITAERNALQQRLNAADQRIDELTQRQSEHPEGKRERFQKWVLATKHPVLGFLDGHWLERGDDREGYANEYVQGLWVAYKEFCAPPEIAELQATIARLTAEIERLKGELQAAIELITTKRSVSRKLQTELDRIKKISDDNFQLVLDQLFELTEARDEIERLKGGQGEPADAGGYPDDPPGTTYEESHPAPVSVVLPERKREDAYDESQSVNSYHAECGWNACLDKVKELNAL